VCYTTLGSNIFRCSAPSTKRSSKRFTRWIRRSRACARRAVRQPRASGVCRPRPTPARARTTQIIQALLSNAIKSSYPGGAITIRARQTESTIQVDIADSGVGIAPEQQQALFRRFYRADNPLRGELGGAGLGLAITKALVELYGGTIWVSSEVGKGSTFSFSLPITLPGLGGEE
jgi:signal transduction histidine kinase